MGALTGQTVITGNPVSITAITVDPALTMTLNPGTTSTGTVTLTVSNNVAEGYTVSVADSMDGGKGAIDAGIHVGKMLETTDGTTYVAVTPKFLAAPMSVDVPDDAAFYTHGSQTLDAPVGDLIASAAANPMVDGKTITATFSQAVANTDPRLPGTHVYRLVPTFTITAL
jgi:hypothetical protein